MTPADCRCCTLSSTGREGGSTADSAGAGCTAGDEGCGRCTSSGAPDPWVAMVVALSTPPLAAAAGTAAPVAPGGAPLLLPAPGVPVGAVGLPDPLPCALEAPAASASVAAGTAGGPGVPSPRPRPRAMRPLLAYAFCAPADTANVKLPAPPRLPAPSAGGVAPSDATAGAAGGLAAARLRPRLSSICAAPEADACALSSSELVLPACCCCCCDVDVSGCGWPAAMPAPLAPLLPR